MSNATTVGWVLEPDGRGTFGILKSCIITLLLCVYTVLHVNVQPEKATLFDRFWTKAKWVLVGTLAPELVVFVAWCQRREARRISAALNQIFKEKEEASPENKRRHEWTTMHGFYAMMGGFVLRTDDPGEQPYVLDSPTFHLQFSALEILARMDLIPDISQKYIQDKSKADNLAKALVICQASWLILQCITRWSAKLPLTALELNVLAHTTSALVMYMLWWEKPLDIQDPTVIDGDKELIRPVAAALWACNIPVDNKDSIFGILGQLMRGKNPYGTVYWLFWRLVEGFNVGQAFPAVCWLDAPVSTLEGIQAEACEDDLKEIERAAFREHREHATYDRDLSLLPKRKEFLTPFIDTRSGVCYLTRFCPSALVEHKRYNAVVSWDVLGDLCLVGNPTWTMFQLKSGSQTVSVQNHVTATWWSLLRLCIGKHPEVLSRLDVRPMRVWVANTALFPDLARKGADGGGGREMDWAKTIYVLSDFSGGPLLVQRVRNISRYLMFPKGSGRDGFGTSLLVLSACAVVYGGVHAAAWNDHFPTNIELLLWRISSIYVAAFTISVMATFGTYLSFGNLGNMQRWYWNTKDDLHPVVRPLFRLTVGPIFYLEGIVGNSVGLALALLLAAFGLLAYLFCRSYLVVEAFCSLRSERVEVYETPDWTRFLLHL